MARRLIETFKRTKGTVDHVVKVYRDSEWGEWVVIHSIDGVRVGGKDGGYHTSDEKDAMSTAIYMIHTFSG